MKHLVILIIQLTFLLLYTLCVVFAWPGIVVTSIYSWGIPVSFYTLLAIFSLLKKQHIESITYFLFSLLVLCIPNKIWFTYHHILLQLILILGFTYVLFKNSKYPYNRYFKIFSYLIVSINVTLLFTSDNFISKHLKASYLFKPYSETNLSWNDFNPTDSIKDGFHARINTYIAYRVNKVYNFTCATAVAKSDIEQNLFVSQSDNLLKHELYHFKITELMTQKLNRILEDRHFCSANSTKPIILTYIDSVAILQKTYDTETNHNLNTENQILWERKIDKGLKQK
jgi:hypothetical protein